MGLTYRMIAPLCLGAVLFLGPVSAQETLDVEARLHDARARLETAAREVAEISAELAGEAGSAFVERFKHRGRRAMLGINLGDPHDSEAAEGALIAGVTPGGPAETAGLQAGDVLIEVNGQALTNFEGRGPTRQLMALMRDVNPGDVVNVKYRRNDRDYYTDITTGAFEPPVFAFFGDGDFDIEVGPHAKGFLHHMPFPRYLRHWGDMELVGLTARLGTYFGTEAGILVVRAPRHPGMKLEDGDVIKTIGGRTPSNPSHALRILRSYQSGERLTLEIVRDKQPQTVEVEIPDDDAESRG